MPTRRQSFKKWRNSSRTFNSWPFSIKHTNSISLLKSIGRAPNTTIASNDAVTTQVTKKTSLFLFFLEKPLYQRNRNFRFFHIFSRLLKFEKKIIQKCNL